MATAAAYYSMKNNKGSGGSSDENGCADIASLIALPFVLVLMGVCLHLTGIVHFYTTDPNAPKPVMIQDAMCVDGKPKVLSANYSTYGGYSVAYINQRGAVAVAKIPSSLITGSEFVLTTNCDFF